MVTGLAIKRIDGGTAVRNAVPPGARLGAPVWSPDGRMFAISNTTAAKESIEHTLWEMGTWFDRYLK